MMGYEEQVHIACCIDGCGHVICMSVETENQYRRSHASFTCPAGHSQHFTAKTDREKELDRVTAMRDRFRTYWHEATHDLAKARVESRTCPLCHRRQRTRKTLARHLQQDHGAMSAAFSDVITADA